MKIRLLSQATVLAAMVVAAPVTQASDDKDWDYTPAFLPVTEPGLASVAAHGSLSLQNLLLAGGGTRFSQLETPGSVRLIRPDSNDGPAAAQVAQVLHELLEPLPNLFDMDFDIAGIRYRPDEQVVTLDARGAIHVRFPETVDRVSLRNVQVGGRSTPPLGDFHMYNLSFHEDSFIRIVGR
ncbi:MAG TPA: hypothetical protein VKY53_11285 [Marinobacter sp.]|nr:hypothetical protein [Marinobacter sp.]